MRFPEIPQQTGTFDKTDPTWGHTGTQTGLSALDARAGGVDDAFTFLGTSKFTGAGGERKVKVVGSRTFVLADIDGDKKFDFGIQFDTATLDASDFIL